MHMCQLRCLESWLLEAEEQAEFALEERMHLRVLLLYRIRKLRQVRIQGATQVGMRKL